MFSAPEQVSASTDNGAPQVIPSIGDIPEKAPQSTLTQETQQEDEFAPAELVPQAQEASSVEPALNAARAEVPQTQEEISAEPVLEAAPAEVPPAQAESAAEPVLNAAPAEEPVEQEPEKTTTQAEYTPNDLTEIELKEGSTYLISDFVPPSETKDFAAAAQAAMEKSKADLAATAAKNDDVVEEVVPSAQNKQPTDSSAQGNAVLGTDVTVSQIVLENTIKTKRGASLDLKTVPMVKDPADSQRLDLGDTELQDINTQHDVKSADFSSAGGKNKALVLGGLMLVVLVAIYAGLAYLQIIPNDMNFINPKQVRTEQEQTEQLNEMLPTAPVPQAAPQVNPADAVLSEVKNYTLPNGMTLEQLIATRHPNAGTMTEWSISTAVDPDNYSVMVKVPPENPQSFKLSYRFNYNTETKTLEPTISDSKNLLMSAGVGQPAPVAQQAPQMPYQPAQPAPAYNQPQPRPMAANQAVNPHVAQQQRMPQPQVSRQRPVQRPAANQRRPVQRPVR